MRFDETKGIYVKLYLLPERHKDTKRKTQVSLFCKFETIGQLLFFELFISGLMQPVIIVPLWK